MGISHLLLREKVLKERGVAIYRSTIKIKIIAFLFGIVLTYSYLCSRFSVVLVKGCSRVWAEMIPSKPDTDNAGVGMIE